MTIHTHTQKKVLQMNKALILTPITKFFTINLYKLTTAQKWQLDYIDEHLEHQKVGKVMMTERVERKIGCRIIRMNHTSQFENFIKRCTTNLTA